jgi:hypothetical protein
MTRTSSDARPEHEGESRRYDHRVNQGVIGAFGIQILATKVVDIRGQIIFLLFIVFVAIIVWLMSVGSFRGESSAK